MMKKIEWIETEKGGLVSVAHIEELFLYGDPENTCICVMMHGMELVLKTYCNSKNYIGGFPVPYKGKEAAEVDFEIIKNFLIYGDEKSCVFGRDKYLVEE